MTTSSVFIPGRKDVSPTEWQDWRWQYRQRLHTRGQLTAFLKPQQASDAVYDKLLRTYPFCITPYYLSLVEGDYENDPIGRQCFPDLRELDAFPGDVADPLGEEQQMPVPGVVHRYPDRCLTLITTGCFTYCRHCNRKRRWNKERRVATQKDLQLMIAYIAHAPAIREVIISGGDPLTLHEGLLDWFLGELRALPHIEVLRLGSRIPVVMPMRVTKRLCRMLRKHRPLWLNTQFNHAREINADAARACAMLLEAGIPLSNQSVLLAGVNDSYEAMRSLLWGLQRIGVRPYYLFQGDDVEGTGHLRADISRGREIMARLGKGISGLCLPRYMLDTPGEMGKILLV